MANKGKGNAAFSQAKQPSGAYEPDAKSAPPAAPMLPKGKPKAMKPKGRRR